MRDITVSVKRDATYHADVTQKNMFEAITLFIMTYGNKGLEKIDDKGESTLTEPYIESIAGLNYESE